MTREVGFFGRNAGISDMAPTWRNGAYDSTRQRFLGFAARNLVRPVVVVQFAANHAYMMAIYFMYFNFVRIHKTLRITPAMAAGVTSKLWEMSDMVAVLQAWEKDD